MNTYNDNLQDTVNKTLAMLTTEQARLDGLNVVSDYQLYSAQGTEIKANDTQRETVVLEASAQALNHLVLLSELEVSDLQLSATSANDRIALSVTNMATAAANINIASNAVAALAADIGAALNNTFASLYQTDMHHHVAQANTCIYEVANEAKELSRLAMDASSKASEVVTQSVLNETAGFKSRLDTLFSATQAASDNFSQQLIGNNAALVLAMNLERQAEGGVKAIESLKSANKETYHRANSQLNMGLTIKVHNGSEIGVSFQKWSAPMQMPASEGGASKELKALADKPYCLMLLPSDQAATFTIDQAEQALARKTGNYYPLEHHDHKPIKVALKHDINGEPVLAGKSYVAYLHVELSMDYHRIVDNFADLLSSPSLSFIPATNLPLATKFAGQIAPHPSVAGALTTLYFSTAGNEPAHQNLEFRCILIEESVGLDEPLLTSAKFKKAPVYFNKDIALQVAPSNYVTATCFSGSKPSRKKGPKAVATTDEAQSETVIDIHADNSSTDNYSVSIFPTTTDNFGSLLRVGITYKPYILAVINSESDEQSDKYVSVLSPALDVMTLPANQ